MGVQTSAVIVFKVLIDVLMCGIFEKRLSLSDTTTHIVGGVHSYKYGALVHFAPTVHKCDTS